jgi:hypothetical protein
MVKTRDEETTRSCGPCSGALYSNVHGSGCPASFGSVLFQGFVGPYTYSVSSCTSNLWSTRAATVDQLAIAETSSHRHLDQLIQISYLRSAGVNGAVNLLETTSLTVQELSGLLVHDVYYKCQYGINSSTRSKGRTYRVRQTQACSTLQNQVNK